MPTPMPTKDPRVDAYIAKQADFARPILERFREFVHESCPDVTENIKWGMPSFEYKGLLCGFAAFKAHATFGFWKHDLVIGEDSRSREAMGSFGRLTSLSQLPSKRLFSTWMKKAMKLNEDGITAPREKRTVKKPIAPPRDFAAALAKDARAFGTFKGLAPSHKREYIEWITEAKRPETRSRRIATSLEWLAAGKSRNWKYEKA
jgi:uncharacterized protein YdeI (YjbR/CyaY-like superfamily)